LREGLPPGTTTAQAVEPTLGNPDALRPAAGKSRPTGMGLTRSPTEGGPGGASHGRPKAVEHP
jgi:hypothetical protein